MCRHPCRADGGKNNVPGDCLVAVDRAGGCSVTAPARRPAGPMGGGPAARMMMGGAPTEKLQDFKGSTKRLLGLLKPHRLLVAVILLFGVCSVFLTVLGPRLLGHATDIIFAGVIGKSVPPNVTKAEAVEALRARGENTRADLLSAIDFTPGHGIDFTRLAHLLAWIAVVYLVAWLFGVFQGRLTARV